MSHSILRTGLRTALLAATCLTASPVLAQETSVEDRLDRLEALVEGLIDRLDAQAGTMDQNNAAATAASAAASEAAAAAMAETKALQARQAELAAQIADPKKQEDKGFRVGNTTISYAGYVKLDAITQRTSGGQVGSGSIVRDFLIPGAIPVGGGSSIALHIQDCDRCRSRTHAQLANRARFYGHGRRR